MAGEQTVTDPPGTPAAGQLTDLARSMLGNAVSGLVGHKLAIGDVTIHIDQLRFSNATADALPHFERMARHATNAANAGPFNPLGLLAAGLNAMSDGLDSARVAAIETQRQLYEATSGRIKVATDLFGVSNRVITPEVELDRLVATCTTAWFRPGLLNSSTMETLNLEFDQISLVAHVSDQWLLAAITERLPSYLRPVRDSPPGRPESGFAIKARRLPATMRAPIKLTTRGAVAVLDIDHLNLGEHSLRLPRRLRQHHEFAPLGPSAVLDAATFDESGLTIEATIAPRHWELDTGRLNKMLRTSSSSPQSTISW